MILKTGLRRPPHLDKMSRHMSFVGQRADKLVVVDSTVKEVEDGHGMTKNGVVKEVQHYTMGCKDPGCDGVGYYDQRGEVICDSCGMVISGEKQPTIRAEFSDSDEVGTSRGLEKMNTNKTGTHEPGI